MIERIKYKEDSYSYPIFQYLYPYVLRFMIKNKLEYSTELELNENTLVDFKELIKSVLQEFLDECYTPPNHKSRSKYPSRYEKIILENQTYMVNYRSDFVGKISYGIYTLLLWLKKQEEKDL